MRITNAIEHLKILRTTKEYQLQAVLRLIKPYDPKREVDNLGVELKRLKDGSFQATSFKPFWLS